VRWLQLARSRYVIDQIVSRGRAACSQRARRLAGELGSYAVTAARAQLHAEVVWFCVPDRAIAASAESLSEVTDWRKAALHSSGALSSDELASLRQRGAAVASVHPLMTFVRGSQPLLVGVPFAIEEPESGGVPLAPLSRICVGSRSPFASKTKRPTSMGNVRFSVTNRAAAVSERVQDPLGSRSAAKERMLPILRQTLANYAGLGAPQSFSGPMCGRRRT